MHASMHLGRLHAATQERLKKLSNLYHSAVSTSDGERKIIFSYIAIELDNLNISTLREFTISTIRRAKTVGGMKISVNLSLGDEEEIAAYMLSIVNLVKYKNLKNPSKIKRNQEQAVRDPKQIEKILVACAASNLPSLQNALALNSNMFRDLKFLRNFYAHRNRDTLLKLQANVANMGVISIHRPDEIFQYVPPGNSFSLAENWLTEAQLFYELLMQ